MNKQQQQEIVSTPHTHREGQGKESECRVTSLLFICLGNICRSPAAEGVMKHIVEREGRDADFLIDSAGIGGWHVGQLPDHRMRRRGAARGYDFCSRARQFSAADFQRFDMILVMDHENYYDVKRLAHNSDDVQKIKMLPDFMTRHPGQPTIPDPYYGDIADFDFALDLIEDACEGLFAYLCANSH
ncbi:MAG: low molecular weight phosphotyrosine protein phosphatase [Prevotella sp.]|nr:low molecular weight phosphotyrosine protein phosphatase [Prevotella sp.]